MINCLPELDYSATKSEKRLSHAYAILGINLVNKIIAYTLFLLGGNRQDIADYLNIPLNTLLSFFTRVTHHGIDGFYDQRTKSQPPVNKNFKLLCRINNNQLVLNFGATNQAINIPKENTLQFKIIILTFLNNGNISRKDAAKALKCSYGNVDKLLQKMLTEDVSGLIDKRCGQQKDYIFTPEVKSELIIQFAVNAATGKSTSSPVLTTDIEKRTSYKLSQRSIRHHINKLGLQGKAAQLWELIGLKKTL